MVTCGSVARQPSPLTLIYPSQPTQNTPQIPLTDVQIFTPHSFFQILVAMLTPPPPLSPKFCILNAAVYFISDFYDNHDVWHIISSLALFFGFVTVLTLDDHLLNKPRNEIRVF